MKNKGYLRSDAMTGVFWELTDYIKFLLIVNDKVMASLHVFVREGGGSSPSGI
jgi:hypothetical protein